MSSMTGRCPCFFVGDVRWRSRRIPVGEKASNLDAAEADLLRVAPPDYLEGQLPGLLGHVRAHLAPDDPRRKEMEELCDPSRRGRLTEAERNAVIAAARAASSAARREILQIRSFRNILYICALVLAMTVTGLLLLGILRPGLLPLCFKPTNVAVCPSGVGHVIPQHANDHEVDVLVRHAASSWDIPIVVMVGVIAAAISAAIALRKLHGTSTPYALPVALAVLKLPTGALTAVLGLLLMRGRLRPRPQRAGQPRSDHRVGDLVRVRAATLHTSGRRPRSRCAQSGGRPRATPRA
jgi:hypothetical protein